MIRVGFACRRRFAGALMVAVALFTCSNPAPGGAAVGRASERRPQRQKADPGHEVVPGQLLVKLRAGAPLAATGELSGHELLNLASLEAVLSPYGERSIVPVFPSSGRNGGRARSSVRALSDGLARVVKIEVPSLRDDPAGLSRLMAELDREPAVEYVEPNRRFTVQAKKGDPYLHSSGSWGQDFPDLWGLHRIEAEAAWSVTRGEGVVVAVTDTGLDYKHKDIKKNVWRNAGEGGRDAAGRDRRTNRIDDDGNGYVDDWRGWDFVTTDRATGDNDPMDDHGHGTHVAGTIAAVGDNGIGIVGVAPGARVMPLKGLDRNGSGQTDDLARSIVYAAENGARVINASWGGTSTTPIRTLQEAIDFAHAAGCVFVAAAGNNGADVEDDGTQKGFYPANLRNVVVVAASDHLDQRAAFSNTGAKVDVIAPGGGDSDPTGSVPNPARSVLSLLSSKANLPEIAASGELVVGGRYLRQAGTSMAAPHAAGVAALVLARNPHFTPEQVRQALRLGASDLDAEGFDAGTGYGRLDAPRALGIANPPAPSIVGVEPSPGALRVRARIANAESAAWSLEYARAESPAHWTVIASSAQGGAPDEATWLTSGIEDGVFVLRMRVEDRAGRELEDRVRVGLKDGGLAPVLLGLAFTFPDHASVPALTGRVRSGTRAAASLSLNYPFAVAERLELLVDGERLASFLPAEDGSYVAEWTPGAAGPVELTVAVELEGGTRFVSGPIPVEVLPSFPPTLRGREATADLVAPGNLEVRLDVVDPDGSPTGLETREGLTLEFFAGDQPIGAGTFDPQSGVFRFVWREIPAGRYEVRAVATDKSGVPTAIDIQAYEIR